jgi:hypothetical protein
MIPKPPSFFGFVAKFQAAKGAFLAFKSEPPPHAMFYVFLNHSDYSGR